LDVKGPVVAVITAIVMSAANTIVGLLIIRKVFGMDLNVFIGVVFGSLVLRGIAILAGAYFCISYFEMHQLALALTFAVVSFVFLMGEILFFHRTLESKKRSIRPPVVDRLKKKLNDSDNGFIVMSVIV
jgi:hypothetical protein